MIDSEKFVNRSFQFDSIKANILTKLEKIPQQFPEHFLKPIHVLEDVYGNVDGQWEQRLRQAKEDQTGERVTLIPYNLGGSHWIGVLIQFKADEQIERAEFIDPVEQSQFVPDELQKQFTKVYPDVILLSKNLQKHDDQEKSAALTVENLIEAAKQAVPHGMFSELSDPEQTPSSELERLKSPDTLKSPVKVPRIKQLIEQSTTKDTILEKDDQSKTESCEVLKKRLKSDLAKHDISNNEELKQRIIEKKQEIQSLEKKGRRNLVQKRQNSLSELELLQVLVDKIEAIESSHSNDDYEILKKQLEDDLAEHDISSTKELKKLIIEKKQEIQSLAIEEKHNLVRKRQNSLFELERLQSLVDKIEAIRLHYPNVPYREPAEPLIFDINTPRQEECLVTEENLRNMYQDFCSMPSCSERSIISLLFYVSLKLVGNTVILDHSIKVPDHIETEMAKELECLKQRLKIEGLESSQIQDSVAGCFTNVKCENWKSTLDILKKLLKEISPLNIRELLRLVKKVDDATPIVKDKDIILFLGGTGSGKSTTIHFLSGSKMVEQEVRGLNHIAPTEIKNAALKKITTSPFARSETQYMIPVTVNFKDVGGYKNGSIILCDSPGFDDTSGPEVDIANGIGIVKAIKRCKSVKPVVLVSYRSIGDRCNGLKDLAHVIVGLIPEIEDHIRAFSYIFTKFPPQERETIHALLSDISDNMNETEKSDIGFAKFLEDMLEKTEEGAQVLDPINDKPSRILNGLATSAVIHNPGEVFQLSIAEKSKTTLKEQVQKHQLSIMSATKRSEYSVVKYKLDQLKCLNEFLDLNYIEQIYNDCIRYMNRHLCEEYEEGISAINRSIINQTVLSNEDIQQYQTCIDHAKLAEELRNTHLGNEVIHSSAFIQYLNQQADIMIEDLREKDVNDLSVKASLDKIKLLSNSFPDLDYNKYKNACLLFAERIEFIINSFKSSVISNKFDKSASEITKLSNALTILHDHLDSQDMETTYVELKEYFLNYLNDSFGKICHIFNQEKLERNDVESLNRCVCLLESAKNTFALQPHISTEAINQIYDNLLSKILNYVEEIFKKINTLFKDENSFRVLEQYITELDLIRTISIIELKTTKSYCSTLEKVVGYIYESRRVVEEQLRLLFRREDKVDYDKLIKCLSSLKSAQWIEKYRSGVYSDVINDVEQQLIQHVKTLNESVIEVNLDLDNFDKIKDTYKIVSEVNEMKHFEKIFSDVSEHIGAINSWFIRVTNDVFIIIKETFCVKKWKEQECQTFNFNKAEKAFHYLDICKTIRILYQSDCKSVLNGLEEFIRYFSNSVHKQMENCFENIKQNANENKQEIFEKARIFVSRLQEVSEIKAKYSRVFSCFSNKNIVEEWQKELPSYLTELSDEMRNLSVTQRTEMLSSKLLVAKALSRLDSFLEGEKYIDVYYKYQNIFFSQTNDVCKQVIDAIKRTDYERVSFEMVALQSSSEVGEHFFKQAKRALNVGLDNLMEETKNQAIMLGNNIEIEGIQSIVENLKRMQRAKQFVSQFLDTSDEIDKCIAEVKQLIEERIKRFLEGVNALITSNNFYEADKKIDSITLVRTLLGNYCTEVVFKQIEALKQHQNNVVLNDVVNKYSEMDISGYTLNPPTDIFAKFGEVNNTNPIYNQALNIIKERILAKFRKELDEAKSKRPPNPENIHIRKFESAVKHLPDAMRSALEIELQHCKDDIALISRDAETNLDKAFRSENLKSIKSVLEEYQKSEGMQSYVNKGRELALRQMQEIASKITRNLEKNDIIEALNNVKKLYDYKIELENIVVEITQTCLEVRSRIKSTFQEAYLCFTNRFLNTYISVVTNDIIEAVEKSFTCLIEFMKFAYEHKGQPILNNMLPEDFNDKITVFKKNLLQYFTERQKKYKDSLEKLDLVSLKDSLDTVKKWNSLFIKMKSYDNMHSINDPSVNTIVKAITELTSYPQMLEAFSHRLQELQNELINQELINSDTKEYDKHRNEFYNKINEKFLLLNKAKQFETYGMTININQIEKECLKSLERKILEISSSAQGLADKFSSDFSLTIQDYKNFNLYYSNLLSFKQGMRVEDIQINKTIENIEKIIFDKIHTWERVIESGTTIENIATILIDMKRASDNMSPFQRSISERIDKTINYYKSIIKNATDFGRLGIILEQEKTGIGQSIIYEYTAFKHVLLALFNEKIRRHGIDYVLDNLNGDFIDKNQLRKRYNEFRSTYESLTKQHLKPNTELETLISDTILLTGKVKQKSDRIEWDAGIRSKIPKLAAHVFALWTLQNSSYYHEAGDAENKQNYLLQPHAAQIISIFRMLGIGDTKEELKNNLVQIGTGEGKSVTLAATAAILALLGFDVCCVCYSEYLSKRDYTAFLSLFDSLGLLNYIHYGTFNKLCEDMINENGNIRQTIVQLISNSSNNTIQNSQQIKRPKILLIDEVDVFFSRDFYGNVYTPSASLRDPTITSLVNFIWTERKSSSNLNKVKNTDEYKACCNRFPNWELLIQEAIKDMLFDVNNFESHDYVVNQDKIGYVEQDNIVYNVAYGYKTLFAYHSEHEKGKISKESLEENISIRIKCGSFSYAEIPLEFNYIMGVTGTLQTLSDPEKQIIQNVYRINKNTFTPSVYGKNNLKFIEKDDIKIENNDDYFNVIQREIDDRLTGKSSEKRPVLVFFESKQKLKEFYDSEALEPIKESVSYLTEEASLVEKESLIRRTTISGQITLFTRTFGRGTDFICHDQNVSANGGTHVIQTFLSEEISEEVQIKGRTARQGDQGSYSMILLDHDLEKFQIEKEHIEDVKKGKRIPIRRAGAIASTEIYDTVYDLLNDKRIDLFKTQYEANIKFIEQAKERHLGAQDFLSNLNSGKIDSVRKFLVNENRGVEGVWVSRTVCLMDATGSMFHLLHKCKNTVDIMFERASQILNDNNISSDSFQIQFAVYRNYNTREDKILQSSPWETRPDNLRAFMNTIEVEGGWHNEAIEIGLWHANKENERENITQVILIGDAPPNLQREVRKKRERLGENYWKTTKFAQPTYYEDELAKLISNAIPIHSFFVETRAEAAFKTIASRTGGRCEMLDINSSSGSSMLTDLVTEEILRNVGGSLNGNALVEAYRKKFGRIFTSTTSFD